jgi:AcrR family transcriptional regulator
LEDQLVYLSADVRRQQIIDAAIEVIATEGLPRATTRRIADRADATLGSLNHCFRGKDELMGLVLERGIATMEDAFVDIDPQRGLESTIRAVVAAYWRWVRDNLGVHLAMMELLMWAIRRQAPGRLLYAEANDPHGGNLVRAMLSAAVEADGRAPATPVDELARFLIHRFDGLVLEYAESRDEPGCERQTELLADALVGLSRTRSVRATP